MVSEARGGTDSRKRRISEDQRRWHCLHLWLWLLSLNQESISVSRLYHQDHLWRHNRPCILRTKAHAPFHPAYSSDLHRPQWRSPPPLLPEDWPIPAPWHNIQKQHHKPKTEVLQLSRPSNEASKVAGEDGHRYKLWTVQRCRRSCEERRRAWCEEWPSAGWWAFECVLEEEQVDCELEQDGHYRVCSWIWNATGKALIFFYNILR